MEQTTAQVPPPAPAASATPAPAATVVTPTPSLEPTPIATPPPSEVIMPMQPKKQFQILPLVLFLVFVVVVCVAPLPYYQNPDNTCKAGQKNCLVAGWHTAPSIVQSALAYYKATAKPKKISPKVTPTLIPTPKPTVDPTATWKVHANAKYSYQFKCPPTDTYTVEIPSGDGVKTPLYQESCASGQNQLKVAVFPLPYPPIASGGASIKEFPSPITVNKVVLKGYDQTYFNQILSTFQFIENKPTSASAVANTASASAKVAVPPDWKQQTFSTLGLIMYSPPNWQSSVQEYPDTKATLIRFWQGATPDTATIQLEVKDTWESTGDAPYLPKNYFVAGIPAVKVDPPKKDEKTLDRYQTNVYFESKGKVYTFTCVHNWIPEQYQICDTMLQTLQFTQ